MLQLIQDNPPKDGEKDKDYFKRLAILTDYQNGWDSLRASVRYHLKNSGFKQGISGVREYIESLLAPDESGKTEINISKTEMSFRYDGTQSITNEEQAIEFFGIDTEKWEIVGLTHKAWDVTMKMKTGDGTDEAVTKTNYATSVKCALRSDAMQREILQAINSKDLGKHTHARVRGKGEAIVVISDIHTGAHVKKTPILKEFTVDDVIQAFIDITEKVNSCEYERVRLVILGDLIESFTGMNHASTWKELSRHGMDLVIGFFEILTKNLIDGLNNLVSIDLVAGNHDRMTSSSKEDMDGEVTNIISYMLNMRYDDIDISFDPIVLIKDYSDVRYILMHGHLKFANRRPADIIAEYGWDKYNVILHGHFHERKTTRSTKANVMLFDDTEMVSFESARHIKICASPIFTGNKWSAGMFGNSSVSGFSIIEPSQGGINHLSYTL